MHKIIAPLLLLLLGSAARAEPVPLQVENVAPGIWALVGEKAQRSPDNLGNNATFGVIDTADGLVLIDPGGTQRGAAQIADTIRHFSTKPVVLVINTGGQDHRWLGNAYWKARGARILASAAAVADQRARRREQINALYNLVGEANMAGTEPVYADQTFDRALDLQVGGVRLELRHFGAAHTPGDSVVLLPASGVLFSGDTIYLERMLGVGPMSRIDSWIAAFEQIAALPVQTLVPGHGSPADLAAAERDTGAYLRALRARVAAFIEQGGTLDAISEVDQSEFMYLEQAEALAGRNAHEVFRQLEFEL
jgi:glyoxylase-like metal-dependent hydrolase (beta-lactamase superfamily II)